eukprot:scaffold5620_cov162-Skeletonema_marinoi.AAC.4
MSSGHMLTEGAFSSRPSRPSKKVIYARKDQHDGRSASTALGMPSNNVPSTTVSETGIPSYLTR